MRVGGFLRPRLAFHQKAVTRVSFRHFLIQFYAPVVSYGYTAVVG